ncbi:DUF3332 family protein [Vibrio cholerae]|nr:DUF3332 family protein [Vibrio cholerae]ORP17694.1 hypothetical protein B7953_19710 [Vibrio paracholerae]MEB5597880.1 DUF3332 family protein [Vibrio cholerae]NOE54484.1 DUF3332 family protein [Vibrio cholerae]RBM44637.1 DUF3332 domain-containing protein [Vibrio paracholerae]
MEINMKQKALKMALIAGLGVTSLTGCMGQMAATGLVNKFNLEVVDNRYAREGLFLLLSPVYGLTSTADLFIFNSIEFWTGKNPISGKSPAVVDIPAKAIIKVNDQLDRSLTEAPLQTQVRPIEKATLEQIDPHTLQMEVTYVDGSHKVLRGEKGQDEVSFYLDGELFTVVSQQELNAYIEASQI